MHNFVPLSDSSDAAARGAESDHVVAIKRWTREILRLDLLPFGDDTVVSVNEFACADAGCPLVETVVAVLTPGEVRTWRFTRPRVAVTKLMLLQTLGTPPARQAATSAS